MAVEHEDIRDAPETVATRWWRRLGALAECADETLALGETALLAACWMGGGQTGAPEDYLPYLQTLGRECAEAAADDAAALGLALARIMGRTHGFDGVGADDGDEARALLTTVIDSRQGSGEALGVLAIEGARRAGWRVEGLSFPARFLVRLADGRGGRVILDPAEGWRMLAVPDLRAALKRAAGPAVELAPTHYAALGNRDILVRLQNDIKMRALRVGAMDRALLAVETALLFAPAHAALWREAGLMNLRLRRPAQAVAALEQFVSRTGDGHDRIRIAQLINEIRGGML